MESILEFLAALIEPLMPLLWEYVVSSPGAFIRWIVFRKKSFREYLKDDTGDNALAFALAVFLVFAIAEGINVYFHSYYHHPVQTFVS